MAEGTDFAGYTIVRCLGSGGMGEVYVAQHPRLPRQDALKVLRPETSTNQEFRERFLREADLTAALSHPNIVGVYDRGEFDGQLWISMEYVDGTDVSRLLRSAGGVSDDQAVAIISAVADALDYAHQHDLLHRDVKPANILISDTDPASRRIKLADFGIARCANDSVGLTATNMTVGTVFYAAPEQLTGSVIDGRADQYALAATAFQLFTGAPPFENSNAAVIIGKHLSAPRLRSHSAGLISPPWTRCWPRHSPRIPGTGSTNAPISPAPFSTGWALRARMPPSWRPQRPTRRRSCTPTSPPGRAARSCCPSC